jgi:hypothetical protein
MAYYIGAILLLSFAFLYDIIHVHASRQLLVAGIAGARQIFHKNFFFLFYKENFPRK